MRYFFVLIGVLVLAFGAAAQDNSWTNFQFPASSISFLNSNGAASPAVPASDSMMPSTNLPASVMPAPLFSSAFSISPAPASPQQAALAIYENYSWQLAASYTFFRFYETPGIEQNSNGLIITANYYFKDWVAGEGEIMGTWAHQSGFSSHFVFAGGGPRFRWSLPRNLELFGHALVGGAHFVPQTSFGSQNAFGYVLGGGLDVNAHHRRFAYRVGADMVGTHFFGTNQFSPRVYAGFVFKF
jgi:hypothetical protein